MVTAQTAWELAAPAGAASSLGLGTQVKAHIERRFSMPLRAPGPRSCGSTCWRCGPSSGPSRASEQLRFEGEFYSFSLLTDFFSPGPDRAPRRRRIYRRRRERRHGPHRRRGVRRVPRPPVPLARGTSTRRVRPRSPRAPSGGGRARRRRRDHLPGVHHRRRRRAARAPAEREPSAASSPSTARRGRTDRSSSCTAGPTPATSCTG